MKSRKLPKAKGRESSNEWGPRTDRLSEARHTWAESSKITESKQKGNLKVLYQEK